MPARDMYHDVVKAALINDGWIITHDPFRLEYGGKNAYIDLGAQHPAFAIGLAAEKRVVAWKHYPDTDISS